jgi:hypothetical protein
MKKYKEGFMPDPSRRLKNIDVSFISLVDKGANLKEILYKSDNFPDNPQVTKTVEILKTDEEKRMVYGIVYSPEETDSQGDITDAKEIEKAALAFMKYRRTNNVDKQHDGRKGQGFIGESWITKANDPLFKDVAPEGSWAVGIKVEKEETWDQVKSGEITGLSLAGVAETIDLAKEEPKEGLVQKVLELVKGKFTDQVKSEEYRRKAWTMTDAFQSAIMEIFQKDYKGDKKKALLGVVDEVRDYVDTEFMESVSKAGKVISNKNEKAIRAAITALEGLLSINTVTKEDPDMELKDILASDEFKNSVGEIVKTAMEEVNKKDPEENTEEDPIKKAVDELKEELRPTIEYVTKLQKSNGSAQDDGQEPAAEEIPVNMYKDKDGKIRKHNFM